jgi:predicted MFS family arabinose efflux permease
MSQNNFDVLSYLISEPTVIWMLAIIGAVCVIGLVDFLKCWVKRKAAVKWVVFIVSLLIAIIISPIIPPVITTIIILWLLILSLATITRNSIVDGLPNLIEKIMGTNKSDKQRGN